MATTKQYKKPSAGRCTAEQALQYMQDNLDAAAILSGWEKEHALGEAKIWARYAKSLEIGA
jgi:hypothetical protein